MKLPKEFLEYREKIVKKDKKRKRGKYPVLPVEVDKIIYLRKIKLEYKKGKQKKNRGKPIGVIIYDKGFCGWSLCNFQAGEKWDIKQGVLKALCKLGSKQTIKDVYKYVKVKRNEIIAKCKNGNTNPIRTDYYSKLVLFETCLSDMIIYSEKNQASPD